MNLLNDNDSSFLLQHAMQLLGEQWRPFIQLAAHIRISLDGGEWCALYGENLQDGVAGFGDSPENAARAFDKAWHEKLPKGVQK
ncbi:MAG: hypothetical protein WC381_10715 [Kiritimatiellia bacterium]